MNSSGFWEILWWNPRISAKASPSAWTRALVGCLCASALLLSGCNASGSSAAPDDLLARAAQEATAILEQAQATALVLQAQAQATAMVIQANQPLPTPIPVATWMAYVPAAPGAPAETSEPPENETQPELEQEPNDTVEVLSVTTAAEGGFIMVRFRAPVKVVDRWWQGSVSIQEEEQDGTSYTEIPVMPKIGPLIGRPKQDGQAGYVMLVNTPPGLRAGALVTVILGDYRFEHIPVQ